MILAIVSQKGGVGKTALAVNLSAAFAEQGMRVLLVDCDPQANATLGVGVTPERDETRRLFAGDTPTIHKTPFGFSVIPTTFDLAGAEQYFAQKHNRDREVLRRALRPLQREWDFIILDCPPTLGQIVVAAVTAADGVIVPITPGLYEISGLAQVQKVLKALKTPLLGIVLARHDARLAISAEALEWAEAAELHLFRTVIPERVALRYATTAQTPVVRYAPRADVSTAFQNLAREVRDVCEKS